MAYKGDKYISPFTDYGFKRLFGEEPNKDLLLDFLNELLREEEGEIKEISYLPNEKLPIKIGDRKAIFDIYCTNEKGEKFIVEMQKVEQKYFKDRTVYYSTFPIQEQATKGQDWNFELKHVYTIGILDFTFDEDKAFPNKYRYDIKLTDIVTKKVFYDKLTYIYLSMPKFTKTEDELVTKFDKWLYVLKHLDRLDRIPTRIKDKIFKKLFNTAEIANLSRIEYKKYEASMNAYRDIKNSIDTAVEKGFEKGMKRGIEEGLQKGIEKGIEQGIEQGEKQAMFNMIENALKQGLSIDLISKMTNVSIKEIEDFKTEKNL